MLKIATWNVNSLRVRLPHVLAWLQEVQPDVLALQEIKMPDADFPYDEMKAAGYTAIVSGQKTYNGMAILSRDECRDVLADLPELEDHQRRVLVATIGDVRVVNLYVPNGESVFSEKFKYKLHWLSKLDLFIKSELKKYSNVIVLGDFNIAPQEIDVHNPILWEGHVLFSEQERKAFQDLLDVGLKDCFRELSPKEMSYSWWDYRMNSFKRNNGLRIDHILASESAMKKCKRCYIDKKPRALERPSDHTPVVAEFGKT